MNSKGRTVLLVSPFFYPNIGGVETYLNDLLILFQKNNIQTDVLTYQPLTSPRKAPFFESKKKLKIWRIPWLRGQWFYKFEKNHPFLQFLYLSTGIFFGSLLYFIKNNRNNRKTIFFSQGLAAGAVGVLLRIFGYDPILNLHTNYRLKKGTLLTKLVRWICNNHRKVLILSEAAKNNLVSIGVQENKVITYHNWVDEKFFILGNKRNSRKKLQIPADKKVYLFVGRLSVEKGIKNVIDIAKRNPKFHYYIVGVGPLSDLVIDAASKLTNLKYLGRLEGTMLRDYFWASDFLVYAPVDEDYLGRSAISALLSGLPIIIPSNSYYMDKKTKVTLKLPEKVGFRLGKNWMHEIKDNSGKKFSSIQCRKYALQYYGETYNSKIIINTLLK